MDEATTDDQGDGVISDLTGDLMKAGDPGMRRITVDPNSFARVDPRLSVVPLDTDNLPDPGERVWAVQPDDDDLGDGLEGVAPGLVRAIDYRYGLIYIEVNWADFVIQPAPGEGSDDV